MWFWKCFTKTETVPPSVAALSCCSTAAGKAWPSDWAASVTMLQLHRTLPFSLPNAYCTSTVSPSTFNKDRKTLSQKLFSSARSAGHIGTEQRLLGFKIHKSNKYICIYIYIFFHFERLLEFWCVACVGSQKSKQPLRFPSLSYCYGAFVLWYKRDCATLIDLSPTTSNFFDFCDESLFTVSCYSAINNIGADAQWSVRRRSCE